MEKVKEKSQIMAILSHLKKHKKITSFEAFLKYGSTRLSGHIYILKKRGYKISAKDISKKTRYGTHVTYSQYSLTK